jgi:hypothetical protein
VTGAATITRTVCAACGAAVRVSKGVLVKHRAPGGGGVCDNSRCEVEANDAGR